MATELSSVAMPAVPAHGDGFRALSKPAVAVAVRDGIGSVPDPAAGGPAVAEIDDLAKALDAIAARAAEQGAVLDFRVDEASGRVIVSLVDRTDGTVLRQMPSEEALRIARALAADAPRLIEVRA